MNCGRNKVDGDHWLGAFNYCDLFVCAEMVHSRMETRFVMCMVGDASCVFLLAEAVSPDVIKRLTVLYMYGE